MKLGDGLFLNTCKAVSEEYKLSGIAFDSMIVDNWRPWSAPLPSTRRMPNHPISINVEFHAPPTGRLDRRAFSTYAWILLKLTARSAPRLCSCAGADFGIGVDDGRRVSAD
jgi:hypothetical protein